LVWRVSFVRLEWSLFFGWDVTGEEGVNMRFC
jgi:hypothetical protein